MNQRVKLIILIIWLLQLVLSCSLPIGSFAEDLNKAVKSNDDPTTVMQALPAYLILLDSLIESDPENEDTLIASSKLIGAYAALIGADIEMMNAHSEEDANEYRRNKLQQQQKKLTAKALHRSSVASCLYDENLCDLTSIKYAEFEKRLQLIDEDDISIIYGLGTAWAAWLQVNSDDWNATAQLPQITLIMQKVIEIDENWDNAGAYMYMGVLNSLLPAAYGGKPEQGKLNFEKAIKLTQGNNLMAKVLFAEFYARLTFNQELHEKLIADILSHNKYPREYILINTIAIQKAKALKASAEDYF